MSLFLVTGRPRSRTAWLAAALTWGDVACLHETGAQTWPELRRRLAALPARAQGTADSSLLGRAREAAEALPEARLVLLESDGSRWRSWARRWGVPRELVRRVDADYEQARRDWQALECFQDGRALAVPEGALGLAGTLERVWEHVGGARGALPAWRTEMLAGLRVEVAERPDGFWRRSKGLGGPRSIEGA